MERFEKLSFCIGTQLQKVKITNTGFKLAIYELQLADQLYLFTDHFNKYIVKFANQSLSSVRIFVSEKNVKLLLILQANHNCVYLKL